MDTLNRWNQPSKLLWLKIYGLGNEVVNKKMQIAIKVNFLLDKSNLARINRNTKMFQSCGSATSALQPVMKASDKTLQALRALCIALECVLIPLTIIAGDIENRKLTRKKNG